MSWTGGGVLWAWRSGQHSLLSSRPCLQGAAALQYCCRVVVCCGLLEGCEVAGPRDAGSPGTAGLWWYRSGASLESSRALAVVSTAGLLAGPCRKFPVAQGLRRKVRRRPDLGTRLCQEEGSPLSWGDPVQEGRAAGGADWARGGS